MRIKEVIKEKGLTSVQVAKKMGVVPEALSRIINGNPTVDTIERVAAAIGVPASEFFDKPSAGNFTCPNCGASLKLSAEIESK
jgi:transcriptional regulator with XRE-family HTH domain